jgi:hypothetical protein
MKKQELVHCHEFLTVVRDEYERRTGDVLDCEEYDRLGIRPTSFARPKADHEEAILALATELTGAMTADRPPDPNGERIEQS